MSRAGSPKRAKVTVLEEVAMITTDVDEVRSVVDAGADWVSSRDIPDPAGWADLRFATSQLGALVRARLAGEVSPTRVHTLPYPKGLEAENRVWTMVNPLDEVVFRLIGGRLIEYSDAALGHEVLSYRARLTGAGWLTKSFKYGGRIRRSAFLGLSSDSSFGGVGTLDVRNYYSSLGSDVVDDVLRKARVPEDVLSGLQSLLSYWQHTWDVSGIPIGPETSGLLGNIGLIPVDEVLRPLVGSFFRMTDDYTIMCSSQKFPEVVERAAETAHSIGLELNAGKVRHYRARTELPLNLFDPMIDSLLPVLTRQRDLGLLQTRNLLRAEVESGTPSPSRVRFCLGVLAGSRDPLPLALITATPELMRLSPSGFGRYLRSMITHQDVDAEWLLQLAMAKPTPHMAAVQYHLLLACSEMRVPKSLAQGLQDFALRPGTWTPLRCAASEAWAASERGRETLAVQAVLDIGDVTHKRAIVLGLRHMNASRQRDKLLSRVESTAAELAPTVSWIKAGAPRAA